MLQFVNVFNCSVKEDGNTIVIHFQQEEPYMPDPSDSSKIETKINGVASLVMERDCAEGLINILSQLLEPTVEDSPNKPIS